MSRVKSLAWLATSGERALSQLPRPSVFVPLTQLGQALGETFSEPTFVVRTHGDPLSLSKRMSDEISRVDTLMPVFRVRTMAAVMGHSIERQRFQTLLLGSFAALALALAAIGIYGVMSYGVTRRRREIGIRSALGAKPADVLRMIAGEALRMAVIGLLIGIAGALALTRLLESLLFGVRPCDPLSFVAISLVLLAVAFAACWIPARRAAKVDPMTALRYE